MRIDATIDARDNGRTDVTYSYRSASMSKHASQRKTHFPAADHDDPGGYSLLNHSIVSLRPSVIPILGSKPNAERAKLISGVLRNIGVCARVTWAISPLPKMVII